MNVLLIGGGGREHAMAWKLSQNPDVNKLLCIPGNGGIAAQAECHDLPVSDLKNIAAFARYHDVDFTIVGPEIPLVDGIVDLFTAENLPIFGPNRAAAQMEGSKVFSKNFMARHHIPTADFREFERARDAIAYLKEIPEQPIVVKADGLAAGKGSIVCPDLQTAHQAVKSMMTTRIFKEAGSRVVIESFMTGEEVSLFVVTDGKDYCLLTPAQDFKRALDNDRGKNTGGMGSYAPTPFFTPALKSQAVREIIEPTLEGLSADKIDYRGVLYIGLMLTPEGPRVIEFNCRFGDPETQVILPLLKSDLLELTLAVQQQKLANYRLELRDDAAVCVVLASGGYPEGYATGVEIHGLAGLPSYTLAFHAGTTLADDGKLLTSGGRVLGITALSPILKEATNSVYASIAQIRFDNMHYRTDIARRAWKAMS